MKLVLDFRHPKLPKLFWVVLLLACFVIVIWQLPVSWLSPVLASKTGCRVMLQQAQGTIWSGSAALAFSESNPSEGGCREPLAVTERFYWSSACRFTSMTCVSQIQFSALEQPQLVTWGFRKSQLAANQIRLPANILEGLGNPWSTLRPRGDLLARWTEINLVNFEGLAGSKPSNGGSSGVIRIIMTNLSSPVSPVRPLGGYEILANIADKAISWNLVTTSGPLLLKGQGEIGVQGDSMGMQFSGVANAAPEAQESLAGLLSLLGKKEGDGFRLKF